MSGDSTEILVDVLKEALKASSKYPQDGHTVHELIDMMGLKDNQYNQQRVRHLLKTEVVAGRVRGFVTTRPSIIEGVAARTFAYAPVVESAAQPQRKPARRKTARRK